METSIYKKIHIYFSSGTGNSFKMAQWIQEQAREQDIPCTITSIDSAAPKADLKDSKDTLVGLVNPTHGFVVPWHMLKFVLKMPWNPGIHAFCAAARAGMFVGPWQPPGVAGLAAFLPALILTLKGYRVRGTMSVNMPTNWTQLHWGMKDKSNDKVFKRSQPKVRTFADRILAGKLHWLTLNNLFELVCSVFLSWISALYLCFGRFFVGKFFFADNRCDGCGICRQCCPTGGVTVTKKLGKRPYWKILCEGCMRCMAYCPQKAIQASWPWAYVVGWLSLSAFVTVWLQNTFPELSGLLNGLVVTVLNAAAMLASVCVLYVIFNLLGRIPFVNTLLKYTTPTPFWRRYHAPDVTLKDLTGPTGLRNKK